MNTAQSPVRLQYWPASHSVDAPDEWPDSYEFETVDDAVTFAMTQRPADREIAWLRTEKGEVLALDQIRRIWSLRQL
ncbi:hypothetical protein [Ancylobacter terrae]|uniref:hypothetical protein n=1 Tax=Ancylobacter sp. sgz301288 TaxID=3342077 RepID=UPI00385B1D24